MKILEGNKVLRGINDVLGAVDNIIYFESEEEEGFALDVNGEIIAPLKAIGNDFECVVVDKANAEGCKFTNIVFPKGMKLAFFNTEIFKDDTREVKINVTPEASLNINKNDLTKVCKLENDYYYIDKNEHCINVKNIKNDIINLVAYKEMREEDIPTTAKAIYEKFVPKYKKGGFSANISNAFSYQNF